jgi:hypothetical protein
MKNKYIKKKDTIKNYKHRRWQRKGEITRDRIKRNKRRKKTRNGTNLWLDTHRTQHNTPLRISLANFCTWDSLTTGITCFLSVLHSPLTPHFTVNVPHRTLLACQCFLMQREHLKNWYHVQYRLSLLVTEPPCLPVSSQLTAQSHTTPLRLTRVLVRNENLLPISITCSTAFSHPPMTSHTLL